MTVPSSSPSPLSLSCPLSPPPLLPPPLCRSCSRGFLCGCRLRRSAYARASFVSDWSPSSSSSALPSSSHLLPWILAVADWATGACTQHVHIQADTFKAEIRITGPVVLLSSSSSSSSSSSQSAFQVRPLYLCPACPV